MAAVWWFFIGIGVLFTALLIVVVRRTGGGDRHGTDAAMGKAIAETHHFNQNSGPGA